MRQDGIDATTWRRAAIWCAVFAGFALVYMVAVLLLLPEPICGWVAGNSFGVAVVCAGASVAAASAYRKAR